MVIWLLIGLLLTIAGGMMIGYAICDDELWGLGVVGSVIIMIGIVVVACLFADLQESETSLKEEVEKSYYYDGFKIDIENVDLNEFTIIYNAEKDTYTLIRKEK